MKTKRSITQVAVMVGTHTHTHTTNFNRLETKFIPVIKYLETSHGSIDTFQFLKQKQHFLVGLK